MNIIDFKTLKTEIIRIVTILITNTAVKQK